MSLAFRRRPPPATQYRQVSRIKTIPAPVGGINAVDSLASMPPTDAITLINAFPQPSYVAVRNGSNTYSTGLPGWVETLAFYRSATAHKIFAWSSTSVYDVTAGGAVGAAVVTGLTNARWESVNIATPGGQFLYAGNATDKPLYYDGSAWVKVDGASTPAITGVTTTTLRNPVVWKNRLWWVQDQTLSVWYLPLQSVGGAVSQFPLQEIFRLGGQIQAIITASLYSGDQFNEYIGFLTSEGELALYTGIDPDFSGMFNQAGIYRLGRPIGRRCWFKVGGDAVILSSDGFVSVQKLVQMGNVGPTSTISYKIVNLINADVQNYSANFGWEGQLYPLGTKILINVPETTDSVSHQYVMNTITGAWCKFTGWNAATFLVDRDTLYYGGNTTVVQADMMSQGTDVSSYIQATWEPAFGYLDYPQQKRVTMVRPNFQAQGILEPAMLINTDYNVVAPSGVGTFTPLGGPPWNTSPWNTTPWGSGYQITKDWHGVTGTGFAVGLYMVSSTNQPTQLLSIDYAYEPGGVL